MAGDPYFLSVSLLVHCDGTNGSTTFTDTSPNHMTLGATGVTVSTTSPKFGTGAASVSNANSYITNPSVWPPFQFGSGQFTVEGWIYFTSFSGSASYVLIGNFQSSTNLGWDFGFFNGSLAFFYSTTGTNSANVGATYTPTLNTWIHIAADRDASNVLRVYANGVIVASATVSATLFASTRNIFLGNDGNTSRGLPGRFDDIRVTKGVARYGGAFTPPTAAFPDTVFTPGQAAVTIIT